MSGALRVLRAQIRRPELQCLFFLLPGELSLVSWVSPVSAALQALVVDL